MPAASNIGTAQGGESEHETPSGNTGEQSGGAEATPSGDTPDTPPSIEMDVPAAAITRNDEGVLIFLESTTGIGTTEGEEVETACGIEIAEPPTDDFGKANLSYHNAARAAHGAMPLTWDAELAEEA